MKYVIINSSEVSSVNFEEVLQTSSETLRYNLDGTKTFVKYEGNQPSFLNGKTELTHAEIMTELAKETWTEDEE